MILIFFWMSVSCVFGMNSLLEYSTQFLAALVMIIGSPNSHDFSSRAFYFESINCNFRGFKLTAVQSILLRMVFSLSLYSRSTRLLSLPKKVVQSNVSSQSNIMTRIELKIGHKEGLELLVCSLMLGFSESKFRLFRVFKKLRRTSSLLLFITFTQSWLRSTYWTLIRLSPSI